MKVTADTSILIHLSVIGRFYLLKELFGVSIVRYIVKDRKDKAEVVP